MEDDYVDIGRWFSILNRRSQLFVVEACAEMHLTYLEYVMLIRIYDHEGARQDDLAEMLFLDKAVVTRTMNLLQEKGLVRRERDEDDRRVRRIFLTDYGREKHAYLRNIIQRWVDYLTAGMDPEEVRTMIAGFRALAERASQANLPRLARHISDVPEKGGYILEVEKEGQNHEKQERR